MIVSNHLCSAIMLLYWLHLLTVHLCIVSIIICLVSNVNYIGTTRTSFGNFLLSISYICIFRLCSLLILIKTYQKDHVIIWFCTGCPSARPYHPSVFAKLLISYYDYVTEHLYIYICSFSIVCDCHIYIWKKILNPL